jgi:hypothetical protein
MVLRVGNGNGGQKSPVIVESWFFKWLADEDFWKQIVINVASGMVIALGVWGLGIAAGIFQPVRVVDGAGVVLEAGLLICVLGAAIATTRLAVGRVLISNGPPRLAWWALSAALLLYAVLLGVGVFHAGGWYFFGILPPGAPAPTPTPT